ncbi:MAG: lysostaphin resistance A-like protein [Bacteroidales bacterium]
MKKLIFAILFAAVWWFFMFSPWTKELADFWSLMSVAAMILTAFAVWFGEVWKQCFVFNFKAVALGIISAVVLWCVFFIGDKVAAFLFDFAKDQVHSVYTIRDGGVKSQIIVFLCLIGPAEELFWRGYVQEQLSRRFSPNVGFFMATAIYTMVHIWSFNLMLILAAAVAGTIWGLMYRFNKNLTTLMISHTLWDIAVLVLFPIL